MSHLVYMFAAMNVHVYVPIVSQTTGPFGTKLGTGIRLDEGIALGM